MSHEAHERASAGLVVGVAVLTLSDTRTLTTDASGDAIVAALTAAGHRVAERAIIADEPAILRTTLERWLGEAAIAAIITNGGTGISRRDGTIDVVRSMIDTPLPGFGELFRSLSYAQVGSAAMLSRAEAGIARGRFVAALPGSTPAVRLAMHELLLPQLRHIVHELRK